jgi:hypothetical protein
MAQKKKKETKRKTESTVSLLGAMELPKCRAVMAYKVAAFRYPCGLTIQEKLIHKGIRFKPEEAKLVGQAHLAHDQDCSDSIKGFEHEWTMTLEVGDEGKDGFRPLKRAYASDMWVAQAGIVAGSSAPTYAWASATTSSYAEPVFKRRIKVLPKKRPEFTGLVERVAARIDQARTALGKDSVVIDVTSREIVEVDKDRAVKGPFWEFYVDQGIELVCPHCLEEIDWHFV